MKRRGTVRAHLDEQVAPRSHFIEKRQTLRDVVVGRSVGECAERPRVVIGNVRFVEYRRHEHKAAIRADDVIDVEQVITRSRSRGQRLAPELLQVITAAVFAISLLEANDAIKRTFSCREFHVDVRSVIMSLTLFFWTLPRFVFGNATNSTKRSGTDDFPRSDKQTSRRLP